MYRKDKIAVVVDNYKRKRDSNDEDEDINEVLDENQSGLTESESSSEENKDKREDPDEIKFVKTAQSTANKDENNQVTGFNKFLERVHLAAKGSEESTESKSKKIVTFQVLDPNVKLIPPSPFTVTSINQSHDLQRVVGKNASLSASQQSSEEWLRNNGLEVLGLTIEHLVSMGKLGQPRPDEDTGDAVNCLIYDEMLVTDFEYKIHTAIELYSKRIKWYLQGSRKMFGLVVGANVGVLLDCSDANLSFGRFLSLQDDLLHLVDEQLANKSELYIGQIGTSTSWLWETAMPVNCRVVDEVKETFSSLQQLGGCNLMQAVKQVLAEKSLDKVVLILGSNIDQDAELFLDYFHQLTLGRQVPFHCIAYETQSESVNRLLKKIAEITNGIYHRYSSTTEELIYTGNDIDLLLREIEAAQELLSKIALMRTGQFSNQITPMIMQIRQELRNMPQSEFLPQPPNFNDELSFEVPKFEPASSDEWLKTCGLKANKLNLFGKDLIELNNNPAENITKPAPPPSNKPGLKLDSKLVESSRSGSSKIESKSSNKIRTSLVFGVTDPQELDLRDELNRDIEMFTKLILSPNSYEQHSEFVPSIGKMVTSSVYEKSMIKVKWPDGTERNVHADLAQLFEYQKLLGEQVKLMEQRINWLASGSRRLFGTIVERRVVFIVDMSLSNLKYLVHIQHSLKILIQQQLSSKDKFNFVIFNRNIVPFASHMVPVTQPALINAWNWIKTLGCNGSRNFMGALKFVLENQQDTSHNDLPDGIYLFTSGIPDQQIEPLMSYIEERLLGTNTRIHTVLFNVDDYDSLGQPIPSRYANITHTAEIMRMIAHQTRGRFHWFRESGIIESDDIRVLIAEIDLAVEYSRRTQDIIRDFKNKYPDSHFKRSNRQQLKKEAELCRRESSDTMVALRPPRPTSLSKAREKLVEERKMSIKLQQKKMYKTPMQLTQQTQSLYSASGHPPPPGVASAFYTETGNSKGVIYRDNNNTSNTGSMVQRKNIGRTDIPSKEEWITSRDWMKKYSLRAMGLNLLRLVSGPDCRHEESFVLPIEKFTEARYCNGLFPIVNVRGTRKHMQYTPTELRKYDIEARKALLRYLKRLEWLMIGSKRIFGVIIEKSVSILLDTSGSMIDHMPELILNLKALIWEQLFKHKIQYNLIAFNSQMHRFRERSVLPDEVNCHSAVGWVEHLTASGNTDTCKALLISLEDPSVQGIYLLSDGKPDSSTDYVLRTVREEIIKKNNSVAIHTISFNCEDETANHFMKELSRITGGRYHKVCHQFDVRMFSQKITDQCQDTITTSGGQPSPEQLGNDELVAAVLSVDPNYPPLPQLYGDDLEILLKEIQITRINLSKTNYFRQLYFEMRRVQQLRKQQAADAAKNARFELARKI